MHNFKIFVNITNMDLKEFLKNLTKYNKNYNFTIINNKSDVPPTTNEIEPDISTNINENLAFLKSKYNTLISPDVKIREFNMFALNKKYQCFIIYIDGLVDSISINNFVLEPLMSEKHRYSRTFGGNLYEYIDNCLLPQNSVKKIEDFKDIFSGINMGDCLLFIDTLNIAFGIDVKKFQQRSISVPENESVIKGPQEGYVENLRTNTSLLRRIINNENLVIENIDVGKITQTRCGVCYMQNIANGDLVSEVKYRLNNLDIDSLLSTGQLEQLIEDHEGFGIPQILSTERPDKCAKYLLQGRVVVLVNGNPYALIMPATIEDFLFSPEDTNLRPLFANFLRGIRILATLITLLLPGIYMAITSFHQELLPTELLFSILSARENVPFPIILELLLMEISFELIREASLRVPSLIGSSIGIVGALILGDAAVNAGIEIATGLYFKVVDSDDWVKESAYLTILDKLRELAGGSCALDMLISNYVYEKEGAKHKKVMRQKGFPQDKVFTWSDIPHFFKGHYILMHSVIYRTALLRESGVKLPEHTFYVDNIFVYQPLPKFPAVTRDIAVVCDKAVTVGALESCIRRGAKGLLKEVALFDIYTGTGIAPEKKSVAFSLAFRADDRNLTAEEADSEVKAILALLESQLGAVLR